MINDPSQRIDELVDKARALGCLIWLDATDMIVFLDRIDQSREERREVEAIVRELTQTHKGREALFAVLTQRRQRTLAELGVLAEQAPSGSADGESA